MSAIASPSVKVPHQPVEIVHNPKPTSLTVRSVFLYVRKRMPHNSRTLPGHASDGAVTSALARFLVGIFRQVAQRIYQEYPLGRFTTAIRAESFSDV